MSRAAVIATDVLIAAGGAAAIAWLLWRCLKGSREPKALIVRWAVTVVVLYLIQKHVLPLTGASQLFGILLATLAGLVMAIIWVPVITEFFGRKAGSLFDGGDEEITPTPAYSIAKSKRANGKYLEAVVEIRKQLARFPDDFEGSMLLAEIQAKNLADLQSAQATVHRLVRRDPPLTPINIEYALSQLADWHLELAKDYQSAREAFDKIIELLPDTDMAARAAQRIGRLAEGATHAAAVEPHTYANPRPDRSLRLVKNLANPTASETDPAALAGQYVKHLSEHPLDAHVRENLAVIYAEHYHRLDLAADQLEQLIQQPNQPVKQVVHWLNRLADLQINHGGSQEDVVKTLERIIALNPGDAAAQKTQRRLDIVKLEIKGKEKGPAVVKLGSYERNVGLKRGWRKP